jgi:hypothetical protein
MLDTPTDRLQVIHGQGCTDPLTGQQVITEECKAFVSRLRQRAAALNPVEAEEVVALADRLSPLAGS